MNFFAPISESLFFPMVPVLSLLLCPCWTDQILSSTTTSAFIGFPFLKTQNSLTSSRDCIFRFKFSKDKDFKVRCYLTMCFSKMSGTSEHCFQLQTESATDGMLLERPEYLASAKCLPFLTIASRQLLVWAYHWETRNHKMGLRKITVWRPLHPHPPTSPNRALY